jgi:hypothetical protein
LLQDDEEQWNQNALTIDFLVIKTSDEKGKFINLFTGLKIRIASIHESLEADGMACQL